MVGARRCLAPTTPASVGTVREPPLPKPSTSDDQGTASRPPTLVGVGLALPIDAKNGTGLARSAALRSLFIPAPRNAGLRPAPASQIHRMHGKPAKRAKDRSPRRKPWSTRPHPPQAPLGAKEITTKCNVHRKGYRSFLERRSIPLGRSCGGDASLGHRYIA